MRPQHLLKERQPFGMYIGVRNANGQILDMDDDHMRIRRADIVLNNQPPARSCGSGSQSRMPEFQFRCTIDPGHEGRDQRAIRLRQSVGRCPIQGFLGQRRLHRVQSLMQVHHQTVQAVLMPVPGPHHRGCHLGIEQIVFGRGHFRQ